MSILDNNEIEKRLNDTSLPEGKQLVVTPILDKRQLSSTGIDLRLSNQFIIFKPENISHFDVQRLDPNDIRKFQSNFIVPFHKKLILHPHTLVLASSLEFISMPHDCWGLLEGRSSWARLGLIIATASAIEPGFKGCITLELSNLGNLPIYLYPGIRIGNLVIQQITNDHSYSKKSKYYVQIGPEFSKIHKDYDIDIITSFR